jgi:glutamate--cysteine ligase catalytic subunit
MIETTPKNPYTIYDVNSPIKALEHLIKTRQIINDEIMVQGMFINTFSSWPNLGTKDFFQTDDPELNEIQNYEEHNTVSRSSYILDDMVSSHPRFPACMSSTCDRTGKKVEIKVPLYKDANTGIGKIDGHITPDEIHMDSMQFGSGLC